MIETNIFEKWLDAEAERVGQKLANNENLSPDDKLTVVLKGLTNHVAHLDIDLRGEIASVRDEMNKRFERVDSELKDIRVEMKDIRTEIKDVRKEVIDIHKALNNQVWKIVGALSLIGAAVGAVGYILKLV